MDVHLLVLPSKMGIYRKRNVHCIGSSLKFCWVQIACFWIPYPRQRKYIKILTGRYLRCPSVFLSVNIYFINDLLQPVCFHVLELLQHFFGRSLGSETDCDDSDKSQSEAYYQGLQSGSFAQGLSPHKRNVIPDDNSKCSGDNSGYRSGEVGSLPI